MWTHWFSLLNLLVSEDLNGPGTILSQGSTEFPEYRRLRVKWAVAIPLALRTHMYAWLDTPVNLFFLLQKICKSLPCRD